MESKTKILEALNALMKEVTFVPKEKVPQLKYETVSYDGLLDEVRAKALSHGLCMIPSDCQHTNCTPYERQGYEPGKTINMKCDSYVFTFTIWHTSGEFLIVKAPGVGVDEQDKGPGKALTYATKNAWLKALMLKTGDDPDLHQSEHHQKPQQPQSQPRPYQQPVQQRQPQQAANAVQQTPKPSGGTITSNPTTWPPDWQNLLNKALEGAKDAHAIQNDPQFNIIHLLTRAKEAIMSKNPPAMILDETLRRIAGFTLNTALKTTHGEFVVRDVLENWQLFESYMMGPNDKTDKMKADLEAWVPF